MQKKTTKLNVCRLDKLKHVAKIPQETETIRQARKKRGKKKKNAAMTVTAEGKSFIVS
jgi:hypothetical protein